MRDMVAFSIDKAASTADPLLDIVSTKKVRNKVFIISQEKKKHKVR